MKKVAIVGVEGSGKTVMLAGLGELYKRPDADGYFLNPSLRTMSYVETVIARMRQGAWPSATERDKLMGLDWSLRRSLGSGQRPEVVCDVSCLDFAGEAYREAFGEARPEAELSEEAKTLKSYIRNADELIVLVNLSDVIVHGLTPRTLESVGITNEILKFALDETEGREPPRTMIALSQADSYQDTIAACGGPRGVLEKYLPTVYYSYSWLDIRAVSAVDGTRVDDEGMVVPSPDFKPTGLHVLLDWIVAKESTGADSPGGSRAGSRADGEAKLGDARTITLPGGATMEMVWCPATTSEDWKKISGGKDYFLMGSPVSERGRSDDEAQHQVVLTHGFWMGKYPVTQRQWKSVMGKKQIAFGLWEADDNPSDFKGDDLPVENVSWDDCQKFIQKIHSAGLETVSLPTEAQWEYACRAGTTTPFSFGSTLNGNEANCDGRCPYGIEVRGPIRETTTPVSSFAPNAWGLYDMHGNVREWCLDRYGNYDDEARDPTGQVLGSAHVLRGGGCFSKAKCCRSAYRLFSRDSFNCGFRLVCFEGPRR